MIAYEIPGYGECQIKHIALDYNGTLAQDGIMIAGVRQLLEELSSLVDIHILTADTYGNVAQQCTGLDVALRTFPNDHAALSKKRIVEQLGADQTICIGNGFNDIDMCLIAGISIAVIGPEGCSSKLIGCTDITVNAIEDAFGLLLKKYRLKATLRR